jgi:hypothetical protein
MAGLVDLPNLSRIMIWALAPKSGRTDYCEAGANVVLRVKLEKPLRVPEFERTPRLRRPRDARPIGTPLCVVVPKEEKRSLRLRTRPYR